VKNLNFEDTICAITTGGGKSAVAIIRISGNKSICICNSIFSKNILNQRSHTIHFGTIKEDNNIIDEVLVSLFHQNKSFTGEESVEISCHGSIYIQNKILELLIKKGCRIAGPGEFSMRSFKNGKIDLSQAESITDLIASESKLEHKTALHQLRGGFKKELEELRQQLIDFTSLIELELDFSEEDVEFAQRDQLLELLNKIKIKLIHLIQSFKLGNVIKNGIPVAILGPPNAGKSTLLNKLLNEEKAIVSDIAGTTRDIIEDEINIEGFRFRFIDTAGIRNTKEIIESIGIKKSFQKAKEASIVIFLMDASTDIRKQKKELEKIKKNTQSHILIVVNKIDIKLSSYKNNNEIEISAKNNSGLEKLKSTLVKNITDKNISNEGTVITNIRHYEELQLTLHEINIVIDGLNNMLSEDLISANIRHALIHLGSITGEISTDELLGNIFSNFCIGK